METHPSSFSYDEYKVVLDLIFHDTMLQDQAHQEQLLQQQNRRQANINAKVTGAVFIGDIGGVGEKGGMVSASTASLSPTEKQHGGVGSGGTGGGHSKDSYSECLEKMKKYFVSHK
jgi:hypothetical protein